MKSSIANLMLNERMSPDKTDVTGVLSVSPIGSYINGVSSGTILETSRNIRVRFAGSFSDTTDVRIEDKYEKHKKVIKKRLNYITRNLTPNNLTLFQQELGQQFICMVDNEFPAPLEPFWNKWCAIAENLCQTIDEVSDMAQIDPDIISNYFIRKVLTEGDYLSSLKLQKLIYYAQAWYLALFNKPLFNEDFEAWIYGPVLPSQYRRFQEYGSSPLPDMGDVNLSLEVREHLDEILLVFGGYSAYQLAEMTHSEKPWIKARCGIPVDMPSKAIISKDDIKLFFREIANEQKTK